MNNLGLKIALGSLMTMVAVCAHAVSLDAPRVQKTDWNTRSMVTAKMNADDLLDVVFINNDAGKIEILLHRKLGETPPPIQREVRQNRWEPVLEDAPFVRESLAAGGTLYALAVADLDGNGLNDIITVGKEKPLTVRYQESAGGFSEPEYFSDFEPVSWTSALGVTDLWGDGTEAVVVLAKNRLLIFRSEDGHRELADPQVYPLSGEVPYGLEFADINEDGRKDILYLLANQPRPLRIRFQDTGGGFAQEYAFELEIGADVVQRVTPQEDFQSPQFAYLQEKTGLLELFRFVESGAQGEAAADNLQPELYTTRTEGTGSVQYALGDFDGDGVPDVVAGDASVPEIRWFRGNAQGNFETAITYPALSQLSGLSAGRPVSEGALNLLLISEREKVLAISHYADERFTFPQTIPVEGEPQTAVFANLLAESDGDEILVASKVGNDYVLSVLDYFPAEGIWKETRTLKLDGVRRTPYQLRVVDLDGDGKLDLVVHVRREVARIFRQTEGEGLFEEVVTSSALRTSLLNDLPPERLGFSQIREGSAHQLLVAANGYVRVLALETSGELTNLDQYNSRSSSDTPLIPQVLDIDSDGQPEMVFYDKERKGFQVLERAEDGVYRFDRILFAGSIQPTAWVLNTDETRHSIQILGEDRFWNIPLQAKVWTRDVIDHYETDLKDVRYTLFTTERWGTGEEAHFILIDGKQHLLEVLARKHGGEWSSRLHFTVFEENLHYRGRKGAALEPREVLVEDINGDGVKDVLLLVHDRLLFYPGKAEKNL